MEGNQYRDAAGRIVEAVGKEDVYKRQHQRDSCKMGWTKDKIL